MLIIVRYQNGKRSGNRFTRLIIVDVVWKFPLDLEYNSNFYLFKS